MSQLDGQTYDVVIVGSGITGTALLYTLAKFTAIQRIALIEKHALPSQVNSKSSNNSQTLHFGDIETNYTLEHAKEVKASSTQLKNFLDEVCIYGHEYVKNYKMVLGVGAGEVQELEER